MRLNKHKLPIGEKIYVNGLFSFKDLPFLIMTTAAHSIQYDSRFVKSNDGTEIYTDACGNRSPDCPVLVLIHGAFMVKGVFNPMFEDPKWTSNAFLVSLIRLKNWEMTYNLAQVRYDSRGHGRSGKSITEEAWQSRRFSEDFEAVCKEFEIKEAYVLGWSAGGLSLSFIKRYYGYKLMRL
jgi:pimeloyl-ACP methyl ester carboxylesterase